MLLTGGAGAGRSRIAAEKIHAFCLHYPGTTALVTRKVKTSMSGGTILFYRRKVIGADPHVQWIDSPKNRFEYRNGSILQFIGLLDESARENLKSIGQDGAVDIVDMVEATQFDEEDFNAMLARMRGKAAPWRQIILECNPDAPTHWIKRRLIDGGEASVYHASAQDNPYNPADYQESLARLTGVDKLRLVDGLWVQASGLVYDVWSDGPADGNVTEAAEYVPDGGTVLLAVDDGYVGERDKNGNFTAQSHPRVFLWCQQRPNGQLCVFAESYAVKTMSEQHLADVLAMGYPAPDFAAVDRSAAELRARLHEAGIYTRKGPPSVEESIKELRRWIAPDENGVRRFLVHPRCKHLRSEFASYRYDAQTEKPVKEFDHSCDAARYLCWALRFSLE